MLGAQGDPYLHPNEWQLSFSYRWQQSDRHFRGTHEEKERQEQRSEVINDVHLLDFAATYAFTERFNATLSLPVLFAERSQPIRNADRAVVGRNENRADGIGDMSLLGSFWILDPAENLGGNIALGLGVKFPTGNPEVMGEFESADGSVTRHAVDQSIQPGDGGFGAIVDLRAFKVILDRFTLYATGTYLFNPRNTNHVPTGRRRESESEMSVADQYLARIGVAAPIVPAQGLALSLGGRIEGVPVRDLIGSSAGFRRPGFAISVEPGVTYAVGKHTFALSVPVAVVRNRQRSVSDKEDGRHGDAAFADFLVLFSYSLRLGGPAREDGGATAAPAVVPVPAGIQPVP